MNSCKALLFCRWTLEPVCPSQESTSWLWFSEHVNSHITLMFVQWAPSRPSLHVKEKDGIALQVLFACMPWRKVGLSFVSMHRSQWTASHSERGKNPPQTFLLHWFWQVCSRWEKHLNPRWWKYVGLTSASLCRLCLCDPPAEWPA